MGSIVNMKYGLGNNMCDADYVCQFRVLKPIPPKECNMGTTKHSRFRDKCCLGCGSLNKQNPLL